MDSANRRLFGTDGIRGIANSYPMVPEIALRLGKSLGLLLTQINPTRKPKVIIGKDTRLSGYLFEQAITAGITAMGADVLLTGPLPTPAIAFLTVNMRADAGIVISASHNPFTDNGIKIFDREGFKLNSLTEQEIERNIFESELSGSEQIGKAIRIDDAAGRYIVFAKNTFPADLSLEGIKIVLDCANGAAYKVAPAILEELGATVISIAVDPDGTNINDNCGSTFPSVIKKNVIEHGADIGISLDGDADRVIICDEKGEEIDGDRVLAICTQGMLSRGILRGSAVVATLMSNMGLERFLKERKIDLIRTDVGDKYVVESMRRSGANLGGEKSGHIIFLDHTTTGDGMIASLQVLEEMVRLNKSMSELSGIIDLYPQILKSVNVKEKIPFDQISELTSLLNTCNDRLKSRGRINLRYSGTEPKARIMVEGEDESLVKNISDEISRHITEAIGV